LKLQIFCKCILSQILNLEKKKRFFEPANQIVHIHKQVRLQKYTFMDGLISGRFSVYKSGNFYLRTFLNKKGFYARIRRQSYEK